MTIFTFPSYDVMFFSFFLFQFMGTFITLGIKYLMFYFLGIFNIQFISLFFLLCFFLNFIVTFSPNNFDRYYNIIWNCSEIFCRFVTFQINHTQFFIGIYNNFTIFWCYLLKYLLYCIQPTKNYLTMAWFSKFSIHY